MAESPHPLQLGEVKTDRQKAESYHAELTAALEVVAWAAPVKTAWSSTSQWA